MVQRSVEECAETHVESKETGVVFEGNVGEIRSDFVQEI